MRALTHLRAHDADHAGVVGLDRDPDIDLGGGVGLCERRAGAERRVEAEREPTAGGGGADDERAARNFRGFTADDRFHGKPPYVLDVSLAAMCTADRMRW